MTTTQGRNGNSHIDQTVEWITPERAADILNHHNSHNRPISRNNVNFLSNEMRSGRWMVNGDAISFDTNGNLVEGQHRCTSCVETGIPFETVVIYGLPPEVFPTLGRGKLRNISDNLALDGEKNSTLLGAAVTLVRNFENGWLQDSVNAKLLSGEHREILARHPELRDIVNRSHKRHPRLRNVAITVGNYVAHLVDAGMAEEFMTGLDTGADLPKGSPILLLRNRLTGGPLSGTSTAQGIARFAYVAKALNAFYAGAKIQLLRWSKGDDIPAILGFNYGEPIDPARATQFSEPPRAAQKVVNTHLN